MYAAEKVESEPAVEFVESVVNAHEKVHTYPISPRIHLRMKGSPLGE